MDDKGRLPYWQLPMVEMMREEREAAGITPKDYGVTWHAAFRDITGPTPRCAPGDRAAARLFLYLVRKAIGLGLDNRGCVWTPGEWGTLHRLERVWDRRAQGRDARFEVVGNMPGTPDRGARERINTMQVLIGLSGRTA